MMRRTTFVFFAMMLLVIFIRSKCVFAYIDPGTGGAIVGGSIWPFLVAIFSLVCALFLKFFASIKREVLKQWEKVKRKS